MEEKKEETPAAAAPAPAPKPKTKKKDAAKQLHVRNQVGKKVRRS